MDNLKSSILKSLYFSHAQSIAEISERIGKSIPLVTRNVNELLEDHLIKESGRRASTGGRRAMDYMLNVDAHGVLVAVAVDQHALRATAYNMANEPVVAAHHVSIDLQDDQTAYQKIEETIAEIITQLAGTDVLGIGITIPGFVDSKTFINNSFDASSPLYALRDAIAKRFNIPTYIENDSSAIAIAEKHFGSAQDTSDALVINLNWGVGLGMIIQNKLFRGHSGFAGEFSHIPLADESRLCSCGKKGCLEVEASLLCAFEDIQGALASGERSSLEYAFQESNDVAFPLLLAAYEKGDQLTIRALKKIGHMLGKGVATLIHIMNPERIVVSGRGAAFGDVLLPQILSSIQEYCIPRLAKQTSIQISAVQDVQLLASCCIAIQQMHWVKKRKIQLN
ncbi:ROK family transcriptional regulator [Sphingobacterium suaedae]|uniref:ROK family protein n=1 Tax=Sphingobacterium suaedae TaxID=1686402 RepID=A0ABW5KJY4_9SPHI